MILLNLQDIFLVQKICKLDRETNIIKKNKAAQKAALKVNEIKQKSTNIAS